MRGLANSGPAAASASASPSSCRAGAASGRQLFVASASPARRLRCTNRARRSRARPGRSGRAGRRIPCRARAKRPRRGRRASAATAARRLNLAPASARASHFSQAGGSGGGCASLGNSNWIEPSASNCRCASANAAPSGAADPSGGFTVIRIPPRAILGGAGAEGQAQGAGRQAVFRLDRKDGLRNKMGMKPGYGGTMAEPGTIDSARMMSRAFECSAQFPGFPRRRARAHRPARRRQQYWRERHAARRRRCPPDTLVARHAAGQLAVRLAAAGDIGAGDRDSPAARRCSARASSPRSG